MITAAQITLIALGALMLFSAVFNLRWTVDRTGLFVLGTLCAVVGGVALYQQYH